MPTRTLAALLIALMSATTVVSGQKSPADPLEFYKGYLAVLAKAQSLDELLPFYTKELATGLKGMPKEMQGNYLKMNKRALTNLKVVKRDVKTDTAAYVLEATLADGRPTSGSAKLLKEGGAWKVEDESWAANLPPNPPR
jgi:hypothetical protein